ncbi:MAG: DHH family phosphoesterase [Clostridia bacterium]|nr:DHH family phosphoesterase [Clostridia bacterium]
MNNLFDEAFAKIAEANTIAISSHINVDGDALGSSLGMYHHLKNIGKNVDIFIDSVIPENLRSLPSVEEINNKKFKDYDLVIFTDAADEFRLGANKNLVHEYELKSVQFDHHEVNTRFAKTNIVCVMSSASELVADYLFYTDSAITQDMARCLITGMYTDTGKLSFSSVTPKTFSVISKLLEESGINIETVTYPLYNSVTKKEFEVRKLGYSKIEFYDDDQIAIVALSYEDICKLDIELFMTKSLVDLALPLKTIKVVALMTEFTPNTVFCSFRTKGNVSAKRLAMVYGGNGHPNAAGCKMRRCIFEAEKKGVIENAKKLIKGTL